jgi:hypothetical protein
LRKFYHYYQISEIREIMSIAWVGRRWRILG